jgi:hypothetical protein
VLTDWVRVFLVVELSHGQLVEDVRLAVHGQRPVMLYSRWGGIVPTAEELLEHIRTVSEEDDVRTGIREAEEYLWGV